MAQSLKTTDMRTPPGQYPRWVPAPSGWVSWAAPPWGVPQVQGFETAIDPQRGTVNVRVHDADTEQQVLNAWRGSRGNALLGGP